MVEIILSVIMVILHLVEVILNESIVFKICYGILLVGWSWLLGLNIKEYMEDKENDNQEGM
jgi:hypothetical protein